MKQTTICALCAALLMSGCVGGTSAPSVVASDSSSSAPATAKSSGGDSSVEYVRIKMGRSIFLDPPENDNPSIYLRVRNTSGSNFNLQEHVSAPLEKYGYSIVRNIKNADYVLQANVLLAEEVSEAQMQQLNDSDYETSVSEVLGSAAVGGSIGGVADAVIGDNRGMGAGSVIGALIGGAMALEESARKKRELEEKKATKYFSAVVDIEIRQRAKGEVTRTGRTDVSRSAESDTERTTSLLGDTALETDERSTTKETDSYRVKSDWIRYSVRMVASGKGKNIAFDDISDEILEKMANSVAGMF